MLSALYSISSSETKHTDFFMLIYKTYENLFSNQLITRVKFVIIDPIKMQAGS